MASSSSSSSPIVPFKTTYDVFLSFRGTDTRQNFTSHLYAALCRKNIKTFIDDSLERGEAISVTLLKAIEESKISVIVFSANYASSRWCLDELVKIMECMRTMGRKVLPVFYHVDPSQVRNQTGNFGETFQKVKARFIDDIERIHKWSYALREAANLSGWDSTNYSRESELSDEVADCIMKKLYSISFTVSTELVGIDSKIAQILSYLSIGSTDVRFVGLWGMGGIGKTAIAEVLYSQISFQFDHCCFFRNVREQSEKFGLVHLRKIFFSELSGVENLNIEMIHVLPTFVKDSLGRKKVLVVLDDVNDPKQIEAFTGNGDWFGLGSRIILTSRDKQVINGANDIYKVEGLNNKDALQLLSMKAFKQKHPPNEYLGLSERVTNYAKGVPLALEVLGSHLHKRSLEEWEIVLKKLKQFPDSNIQKILEISYEELDPMQKNIFLDIACFFKGYEKNWVEDILHGCGFPLSWGIIGLMDKSLVTIVNNRLEMHDLIQEMGMDIARRKGNRLWNAEDINHVLKSNMGKEGVEAIFLDMSKMGKVQLRPTTFAGMSNLRLLKLYKPHCWSRNRDVVFLIESAQSNYFSSLPNKLSLLHWDEYPCKSLPSNFFMDNLVDLSMPSSKIVQLWDGNKCLEKLKWLNLSKSVHLRKLPDLSSATNLERIDLKYCESLVEIPSSIQCLHKLTFLDLNCCKKLKNIPSLINLKSLQNLALRYCLNLKMLPEIPNGIAWLELEECGAKEWSLSIPLWNSVTFLSMKNCKNLRKLPSLVHMTSLKTLDLSNCWNLKILPEIPDSIQELKLQNSGLEEWSPSIGHLNNLVFLNVRFCKNLRSLPSLIHSKSLETLFLYGCSNLKILPEIPSSIKELELDECGLEEWSPSIQLLNHLVRLTMQNCKNLKHLPSGIRFNYVENCWAHDYWTWRLNLGGCCKLSQLPEITGCLQRLILDETAIQELPPSITWISSSLVELRMQNCENLEILSDWICELKCLELLDISGCSKLSKLPPLNGICSLIELHLNNCKRIKHLPQLPEKLRQLQALNCSSLETAVSFSYIAPVQFDEESWLWAYNYEFNFCNCLNLNQIIRCNIMEDALLRIHQITKFNREISFIIGLPGTEIPKWVSYQSSGNSITIQFPSFCNTKFLGFAFCVVVQSKFSFFFEGQCRPSITCTWRHENEIGVFSGEMDFEAMLESDHVFIWKSYNSCYDYDWFTKNLGNTMQASFDTVKLKVKKCGVHLMFARDEQSQRNDTLVGNNNLQYRFVC